MDLVTGIIYFLYFFSLFIVVFWMLVYGQYGVGEPKFRKLKKFPSVSVAIPVWNEEKTIYKTLKSIQELDYPRDKLEAVVVNDGSTDKSVEVVNKFISENDLNVKLVNQKNKGKGAAMNNALRNSSGEIFVCLDADSFIMKNALHKMLPYFEDPNMGIVMPLMKVTEPKTFVQKIQWCEYVINFLYRRLMSKLHMVHVAPGPFSVYRKKFVEKVGGFDEKSLTEDLELTLKMQKANYGIVQVGSSNVYTNPPKTWKALYRQRNRWYKGSILSVVKHRDVLFNKKYGDFGFFQAPLIIINGFIAMIAGGLVIYKFVYEPLSNFFTKISSVNFDPSLVFQKWDWEFISLLGLDYFNLFLAFTAIILSLIIATLAMEYSNQRFFNYGIPVIPVYLLIYGFMMTIIWLGVVTDLMRGKVQKW